MIRTLRVTNTALSGNRTLEMTLSEPHETGLAIVDISGLDPGKATINTIEISSSDGTFFSSARYSSRNIVIGMVILDKWPYKSPISRNGYKSALEYNRHVLYNYFQVKKPVTIEIESLNRTVKIDGYVEGVTVGMFGSMQQAQVSIICPNPWFIDSKNSIFIDGSFSIMSDAFEFPFSNEGSDPEIEFGILSETPVVNVRYDGDVETGYVLTSQLFGSVGDLAYSDVVHGKAFQLSAAAIETLTGDALQAGDKIVIDSRTGKKSVTLTRNGTVYNILNAIKSGTTWLTFHTGDNSLTFYASSGMENVQTYIDCDILYGGL